MGQGRRLDSVGAVAEVSSVQVPGEDLLTGKPLLQPQPQRRGAGLGQVLVPIEERAGNVALGDGVVAAAPAGNVAPCSPDKRERIDAGPRLEPRVHGGHDRGANHVRDGLPGDLRGVAGARTAVTGLPNTSRSTAGLAAAGGVTSRGARNSPARNVETATTSVSGAIHQ